MRKKIFQTIEIPEGVEVELEGNRLTVNGPNGRNERIFELKDLTFEKKDNKIIFGSENATKKEKKRINTIKAHIKNMIKGVLEKFEYNLKVCYSHFPISVEMKGNEMIIKNFLGEKVNRIAKIPEGAEVRIDKEIINIKSVDKELAGRTASEIERATQIKKRDRRIFQDGIFIINKSGKEI